MCHCHYVLFTLPDLIFPLSSDTSNIGQTAIDESLLLEFLEDEGVDVSTAKFLQVTMG